MPIAICEYTEDQVEAVQRFNERLRVGGQASQFPLSSVPRWLPKIAGRSLFQEYYLAVDETVEIRGGYILKHQQFWIKDRALAIADFHLPISEGAVNKQYPQIGVQLLRDALQRQPLLFGLGMGGYDESLSRLLTAAKWSMFSVPFFFRIVHPAPFLRNVSYLRRTAAQRWMLDILAVTGLGWLGTRFAQSCGGRRLQLDANVSVELADEFSDWADELWNAYKHQYGFSAVRDAQTLRILYPRDEMRFIRLKITERSRTIGWAVLLNTQLAGHKHFGNMRLGSIVDCFAAVENAAKVIVAARTALESQGVDLIVSNQSHVAWRRGLRQAGFLQGPSNFIFASSPRLTDMLRQERVHNDELHLNRGDGDGPINL